ncbi:glucose-1-phosphate adenylyltransferase subunit GlgD [Parageobacillus sp. VR-IP]|uniref:glucose-1-phosphate adenylyltransferase subunit GlgD n=1 Tax=Parageobacillus sp. VR-IP TaxID=2742205 RepID=UPI0015838D3C|nr:glucose-1-phosphate adenylyltransferase subunit GlgD [Parageobacillus sp. VR-IP]NUK30521.1 glucose-1-phosphate adenylyltransferase subunit GlgD [Parageobacillus sp. VR-IP]
MSNKWMLGVIDATTYIEPLQPLTLHRSVAAVPFAGRYRLIDFVLSSMVNSGIESVAIFPKYQYRSLMDHLGSGKNWDLNRKRDGLFFFPSPDLSIPKPHVGAFAHFEQHIDYFLRSKQKYAVICNSYTICNIDYEAVLERHIANECDITEVRHQGRSLEMFVLETSLLLDLIANHRQTGYYSIVDVVRDHRHSLKICDYEYDGYAAVIDSIESYFRHSMELLNRDIWQQLFIKSRPIYTKVKDEPPTKYTEKAVVKNSMIANGCIVEGHIENSIIFRSVKIGKGAVIKNSIIMQKSQIGEQCYLDSVIVDKDAKIENGVSLRGTERHPFVIRKGTVQGELMNQ